MVLAQLERLDPRGLKSSVSPDKLLNLQLRFLGGLSLLRVFLVAGGNQASDSGDDQSCDDEAKRHLC